MTTPLERARENATGIVSTLVTGLWLALMIAGFKYWLAVMLFGYIVVVPITGMLFDEDEDEVETHEVEQSTTRGTPGTGNGNVDSALDELRARYARGELTEEQFERKVEKLLETDTVENASDYLESERELEHERS